MPAARHVAKRAKSSLGNAAATPASSNPQARARSFTMEAVIGKIDCAQLLFCLLLCLRYLNFITFLQIESAVAAPLPGLTRIYLRRRMPFNMQLKIAELSFCFNVFLMIQIARFIANKLIFRQLKAASKPRPRWPY